jgi:hypothetical protein
MGSSRARNSTRARKARSVNPFLSLPSATASSASPSRPGIDLKQVIDEFEVALSIVDTAFNSLRASPVTIGHLRSELLVEFANVRSDVLAHKVGYFYWQRHLRLLRLRDENHRARFGVGRLDGYRESTAESRLEAVFEAFDVLGISVAGEDYLVTPIGASR